MLLGSIMVIHTTEGGKVDPTSFVKIRFIVYTVDSVRPVNLAVVVPTGTVGMTIDAELGEIVKEYDFVPESPDHDMVAESFVTAERTREVGAIGAG